MRSSFAERSILLFTSLALLGLCACKRDSAQSPSAEAAHAADMPTLQPRELAHILAGSGDKPLLFHVGFKKLFQQAHIPGSEFIGPASESEALERLRKRVADLARDTNVVLYCGCCPWEHCPNVKPAYEALRGLGFTRAKVLLITEDFGTDWVDKGFPVAKGD